MSDKNVSGQIQFITEELKSSYPEPEIRQFTKLIFDYLLHFSATDLLIKGDTILSDAHIAKIEEITARLKRNEPVQYILGETEFLDLTLKVNNSTLIPRPETEELVVWISESVTGEHKTALDIGTGSGCIALGIKSKMPWMEVDAWDISEDAIVITKENAELNDLVISAKKMDILTFELDDRFNGRYDVVVSNPPYVRESEKEVMQPNVLKYEPHSALFVPDSDPLLFYRTISLIAKKILNPGGFLFFEINEALGGKMQWLLSDSGFSGVELRKDLSGKDRMVKAKKVF